jgi:ABC-type transporter Mla subunit MlaD
VIDGINAASDSMQRSLNETTANLRSCLVGFNKTVTSFNDGVHDFSEFHYALQGTVERLDVSIRDFGSAVRGLTTRIERSDRS